MWEVISALAAAAAAVFAGYQIRLSRIDANRRAAFEHIREIEARVQNAWSFGREEAREDVLAYFRGSTPELSPAGRAYLALLNALDVLAYARKQKMVDKHLVDEHLATLVHPGVIPLTFLKNFQQACGDSKVYQDLYAYLNDTLPQQLIK